MSRLLNIQLLLKTAFICILSGFAGLFAQEPASVILPLDPSWEIKAEFSADDHLPGLETLDVLEHEKSKAKVSLYKMKNKFEKLELSVFNFETLNLDGCFFVENVPLTVTAMDETVSSNERHRILPVCWNGQRWNWSLIEFLGGEKNEIYVARYEPKTAPNEEEFSFAKKLFTSRLGLCRPSHIQNCYRGIQGDSLKIQSKGAELSMVHPQHYFIIRSRAVASEASDTKEKLTSSKDFVASNNESLGFEDHLVTECQKADPNEDLIHRVQAVSFYQVEQRDGRQCGFMTTQKNPEYVCQPTRSGGLRTQYSFYSSEASCSEARELVLTSLGLPRQGQSIAGAQGSKELSQPVLPQTKASALN